MVSFLSQPFQNKRRTVDRHPSIHPSGNALLYRNIKTYARDGESHRAARIQSSQPTAGQLHITIVKTSEFKPWHIVSVYGKLPGGKLRLGLPPVARLYDNTYKQSRQSKHYHIKFGRSQKVSQYSKFYHTTKIPMSHWDISI